MEMDSVVHAEKGSNLHERVGKRKPRMEEVGGRLSRLVKCLAMQEAKDLYIVGVHTFFI